MSLLKEVIWLRGNYRVSQRRACGLMAIAVSSFRYQSKRSDEGLRGQMVELARKKPRFGYRRLLILLIGNVERVNHKRVYRVYWEVKLAVAQEGRSRLVRDGSQRPALTAETRNGRWISRPMPMASGRAIRVLTVEDERTRECLTLEVDKSFRIRE